MLFCCLSLGLVSWHIQPKCYAASQTNHADSVYQNDYTNPIFGYAISVPDGLVGKGSSDPAPNHGIAIKLSNDGKDFIWTDASYNVFYYKGPTQEADQRLEDLRTEGSTIVNVIRPSPLLLCNLKALRQSVTYKEKSGRAMIEETVSSVRFYGRDPGLVYTIGLLSSPDTFAANARVFERIVDSFRCSQPTG
jgi:hypothetical protein